MRNLLALALAQIFFLMALAIPPADADVRISGFTDLNLGAWVGVGSKTGTMSLCVYNSDSNESDYDIVATTLSGNFELISGGNSVAFTPAFRGGGEFTDLSYGGSATFSPASHQDINCANSTNAQLRITITNEELSSARAGIYGGTIILTLSPPGT